MGTARNMDSPGYYFRRAYQSELTRIWLPAVCLLALLVGGIGVLLLNSQQEARNQLERRYELRGALASRFAASYVRDVQKREVAYATKLLAGESVTPARFALVSRAFGFDAAVLLDAHGRALNVLPAKQQLIGTRLGDRYAHLRSAVTGTPAVSGVVSSAARAEPIVAFAVPFETRFGRRVFSGGARIATTPLGPFLENSLPFDGAHAYLIDAEGAVVAAGGADDPVLRLPPETHGRGGTVDVAGTEYQFVPPRSPVRPAASGLLLGGRNAPSPVDLEDRRRDVERRAEGID